jgi:hypothetical protein
VVTLTPSAITLPQGPSENVLELTLLTATRKRHALVDYWQAPVA